MFLMLWRARNLCSKATLSRCRSEDNFAMLSWHARLSMSGRLTWGLDYPDGCKKNTKLYFTWHKMRVVDNVEANENRSKPSWKIVVVVNGQGTYTQTEACGLLTGFCQPLRLTAKQIPSDSVWLLTSHKKCKWKVKNTKRFCNCCF